MGKKWLRSLVLLGLAVLLAGPAHALLADSCAGAEVGAELPAGKTAFFAPISSGTLTAAVCVRGRGAYVHWDPDTTSASGSATVMPYLCTAAPYTTTSCDQPKWETPLRGGATAAQGDLPPGCYLLVASAANANACMSLTGY